MSFWKRWQSGQRVTVRRMRGSIVMVALATSAPLMNSCGSRNIDDPIAAPEDQGIRAVRCSERPDFRCLESCAGLRSHAPWCADDRWVCQGEAPQRSDGCGGVPGTCAADSPDSDCCTYEGVDVPAECEMRTDGPYYTCPSGALRVVKGTVCKPRRAYFPCFERAFCERWAEVCLGTLGQGAFAQCVPLPGACTQVPAEEDCVCLLQQHQALLPLCDVKLLSCDGADGEPRINAPCGT